jgi:hypothetical protein
MLKVARGRANVVPEVGSTLKEIRKIEQSLLFDSALTCHQSCICQLCQCKREYEK